jgi:hypothetical protein
MPRKNILNEIERLGEIGCPAAEVAAALDLDRLDDLQLQAHRRGAARGKVRLRKALARAALRGDGRCIALMVGALGVEGDDIESEAVRFRQALRAQMRAEAGEVFAE